MSARRLRCAIYTRTSSEEGLSQDFNSLHAQAEACTAYIRSQAGEGWTTARKAYEDGGFSGGSTNRPALLELLEEIKAGRIDVVVVYKVDRLTRSLADFAKIVEIMDQAGASFVSVTQSFNTTTSMGRLTLNVLLSFAQFEREVTGERIRDKFAASKAKGMWMGGCPPLGYDIKDRTLIVNEAEAETVRLIFNRFLELRSIHALAIDLSNCGVVSKRHVTQKGLVRGGVPFSRGALTALLSNPIYRGLVRHRGQLYDGQHQRIVEDAAWSVVQDVRASSTRKHTCRNASGALLIGKLFDDRSNPMSPSSTRKGSVRYRYYITRAPSPGRPSQAGSIDRVPIKAIEDAVVGEVGPLLRSDWSVASPSPTRAIDAVLRVLVSASELTIELRSEALEPAALKALPATHSVTLRENRTSIRTPISLARPRNATALIRAGAAPANPKVDRSLVRAIAIAQVWMKRLDAGEPASIKALAQTEKLCILHTAKLLPLAYLAPDLVAQVLEGRQPRTLTLTALISQPLPRDWTQQRARFAAFA